MSDYLGHLLARSFATGAGAATTVRPRVASVFEPAPLNPGLPAPLDLAVSDEITATSPNPISTRQPPAAAVLPANAGRGHEWELDESLGAAFNPRVRPTPAFGEPPPQGEHFPAPASQTESRERPTRTAVQANETEPDERPSVIPSLGEHPAPQRPLPALAPPASQHAESQKAAQVGEGFRFPVVPKLGEKGERVRPMMPSVRSSTSKPPPSVAPPTPTIQVTIGRLEVRAVLPPAPARPPLVATKGLSLDDYLQQRATGGRR